MTVFARIDIYNMALGRLPRDEVSSPDENSLAAKTCNRWWPMSLQYLLARASWNFARTRLPLAELATNDRPGDWGYAFELPSDMSWPVRLLPALDTLGTFLPLFGQLPAITNRPDNPGLPYDLAGRTLYTNEEGAVLEYIDATTALYGVSFAGLFVEALYLKLAANICLGLTKSASLRTTIMGEAEVMEGRAIAANNNAVPQTYGDFIPEDSLARQGLDTFTQFPSGWRP